MAYAHLTYLQARQQLAALLGDAGNVYWQDAELGVYLVESLRTWSAACWYWRERGQFPTAAATQYYTLDTLVPALRAYTVTDTDLVTAIQYHLLEPAAIPWTGSSQFSLSDVTNALQHRRDQYLVEVGLNLAHVTQVVPAGGDGRVIVADTTVDVRRLAWLDIAGTYTRLNREDEWDMMAYLQGWPQNPGTPNAYSVAVDPPLTVQLYPAPSANGTLDMLATQSGPALDPAAGVVLKVPDDYCWAVKWGALADLLGKDGPARDPARALYCEQRFREGVELGRMAASVMQARINDAPVPVVSLYEADYYNADWQNVPATPDTLAMAGLNVVVPMPAADGVYSVTVDVVRNAPIPSADADFVQVGREELEAVLSYAQHLACFKMAGAEFEATKPHFDRFMQLAALKNERLMANADEFTSLMDRAKREDQFRPRRLQRATKSA